MRSLKITVTLLTFLLITNGLQAQYFFERYDSIPVREGSNAFEYPWMGGLNCPQFNEIDLNHDGIMDLVVFNRGSFDAGGDNNSHKLLPFINEGTANQVSYTYAPEYEKYFPELHHWLIIRDFNCDGVNDLLSSYASAGAIQLYLGSWANGHLNFTDAGYLKYNGFSGPENIFVSAIDIPGIDDMNGDGDLDVLTFNALGGVINYYENQSMELTGTCADTMDFEQNKSCWGGIFETGLSPQVILDSCNNWKRDPGIGTARHPGSTVTIFDEDGDGDNEVILGDISFKVLNRLHNNGTSDSAHIDDQDINYPSYDVPYNAAIFPACFYLDVNNDGKKDLLASSNSPKKSVNYNCSWYYENVGTGDTAVFSYVTDTFIVDECIDLGEGAFPTFFDYNGDSLLDLVVGNYGYFVTTGFYKSGLALFENVGTASQPEFNLVDRDYMGISNLLVDNISIHNVAPTFADMDNDGDMDMLIGDESGQLHYYTNTAGAGNTANFTLTGAKYFNIDVGAYSTPFLYDVNDDGLIDILVGENKGNVNYFQNRGTKTNPDFDSSPTNNVFGGISVAVQGFITGYSTPIITTLDTTGTKYLLIGNEIGHIEGYYLDQSKLTSGTFTQAFSKYCNINEGERLALTVADLTGNGKLEMVTGNYRGGLTYYKQIDSIFSGIADHSNVAPFDMKVYPNPNTGSFMVELGNALHGTTGQLHVYDLSGRLMYKQNLQQNAQKVAIETELPKGMYLLKVSAGSEFVTQKLVVH